MLIANRSASKALDLALRFTDLGQVSGCGFADLAGRVFDLIIHACRRSGGCRAPPLPPGVLAADGWCYAT